MAGRHRERIEAGLSRTLLNITKEVHGHRYIDDGRFFIQ